ncbi:RseA family anti-sigma factor [Aliiglaciecola sp. CAU 1673]|uniref:sigma-E factor negative regulatory protein n=1 Tax=Aliiglaciecola sp. CAU 1673 TaxID=3032595 RepID=UPI0023DCC1AF|nr:RseA family anti-sigma factor [Aliiglaciecola sp. CAU 1673]MDF2177995.1 RseA family anti-sigma factor [Aliiglaciecola sp. CAU 1673]
MTQQQSEHLSSMMDGELLDNDQFNALAKDSRVADKWRSYHLIRDGLRKELPPTLHLDISARVAAAIEAEPAILAPQRKSKSLPLVGHVIPWIRQGGQFAVAASVAAAVILGVQQFNQPTPEQPFSSAPAWQLPGTQMGGLSPVSLEQTHVMPRADTLEQKRRINAYLADHQRQMRLKAEEQAAAQKQEAEDSTQPQQ